MKRVLFVSDCFLHGGLESHIVEQVEEYRNNGIEAFLACDSFEKGRYEGVFKGIFPNIKFIPKDCVLSARTILNCANKIARICKENKIDFIECQPFLNIIPATIAAEKCKIPISYTLHGTASGDFIDHGVFREASIVVYICLHFGFDWMFAVSERLAEMYAYLSKNISIVRNNMVVVAGAGKKFDKSGRFAIASRIDPPKFEVVIDFLPQLYEAKQVKLVDIYGDGGHYKALLDFIKEHNYEDKIVLKGWVDNLSDVFCREGYDCVFGVGRIVMDAISARTPVGILGYGGFTELLDRDNIGAYAKTNFISWDPSEEGALNKAIGKLYKDPKRFVFGKKDLSMFDANRNWRVHISQLEKCQYKEKLIIRKLENLLKSSLDENILGGAGVFDALYKLLVESGDMYTYMNSLRVVHDYYFEKASILENRVTELNRQAREKDALIEKMVDEKRNFEQHIREIENSTSWKITKPIRIIKDCLR